MGKRKRKEDKKGEATKLKDFKKMSVKEFAVEIKTLQNDPVFCKEVREITGLPA